ncbi:MAG: hypothetical protein KUG56_09730 [Kordiimonadaceae bacterium]|nr:hypothetical protein [Kordiimonadaceae bacterium]
MTVSLHKIMNIQRLLVGTYSRVAFGMLLTVLVLAPVAAQDTADSASKNTTEAAQNPAPEDVLPTGLLPTGILSGTARPATADQKSSSPASKGKERYYFGTQPQLQRQQGPALGTPVSILPRPFVPKGSVVVPPAPDVSAPDVFASDVPEGAVQLSDVAENRQTDLPIPAPGQTVGQTADVEIDLPKNTDGHSLDAAGGLTGLPQEGDTLLDSPQQGDNTQATDEQFLEAASLDLLDPSGLPVIVAEEGYGTDFWQGYSRAAVVVGYASYENAAGSQALSQIAGKIALSGVTLPAPADDTAILEIIKARLALLTSLGHYEGYIDLLERLPAERDWSPLVKHFTNKHLLQGALGDACSLAAAERETDDDPYWLRMAAFCEATSGNRNGVDFQLGILEEVAEVQPTFYQLIDQIIVEAEQVPGALVPEAVSLTNSLKVDLLEVTMARLARAKVPLIALEEVNPLAVRLMLALPGLERDAKIDLMGLAVRRGWIDGAGLAAFTRNHALVAGEQEAALAALDDDQRFVVNAALAYLGSRVGDSDVRAKALHSLWARSVQQRLASVSAAGIATITSDMQPTPKAGAAGSALARVALLNGDISRAGNWFRAWRAETAGNEVVDKGLVSLLPLVAVAGVPTVPNISAENLQLWWQEEAAKEGRFARANLLFTVLEALGHKVPEECWQWLEKGPAVFAGGTPSVALWRRFMMSAERQDVPDTLSQAFALMADAGPAAVPAALAGSLISGLVQVGLEKEARLIATEMLISQGL